MSADYSELAAHFDERYRYQPFPGIAARLGQMVDLALELCNRLPGIGRKFEHD